jgi:hypothetical protein
MILTVFLFPHPCVALWEEGVCIGYELVMNAAPSCEILLPQMCTKLLHDLHKEKKISQIKTVDGPGPFTALRAGKAFAHGLAVGYGAELFCPSFFDIFPSQIGQKMAIHTGIPRWIVCDGHPIDGVTPDHIVVSSDAFSKEATLDLAQRLACYID